MLLSMFVRGNSRLWLPLIAIIAIVHAADARGAPLRGMPLSENNAPVAPCLTVEQCREKFVALKSTNTISGYYYISEYSTKGCFLKRNNVYFGTGGTVAAMSASVLPGIQTRIWCDADEIDEEIAPAEAEDELSLIDLTDQPAASKPVVDFPGPTSEPLASKSPGQPTATPAIYEPTESPSKQPIDSIPGHQPVNQSVATEEPTIATVSQSPGSVEAIPSTMPVPNPMQPTEETATRATSTASAPDTSTSMSSMTQKQATGFLTKSPTPMPIAFKFSKQPTAALFTHDPTEISSEQPISSAAIQQPVSKPVTTEEHTSSSAMPASTDLASEQLADFLTRRPTSESIAPKSRTQPVPTLVTYEPMKISSQQPVASTALNQPATQEIAEDGMTLTDLTDHPATSKQETGFPRNRITPMPIASNSFNQPTVTPITYEPAVSPSKRPIASTAQPVNQPVNKEPTPTTVTQALDSVEAMRNMTSTMPVPDQIHPTAATETEATTTTSTLAIATGTASLSSKQVTDFPTKRPTSRPISSQSAKQLTGAPITYEPTRSPSKQFMSRDVIHQSVIAQAAAEEELMLLDLIDQSVASMPLTDFPTNIPTSKPIAAKSSKQLAATSVTYEPTRSPSEQSIDIGATHQSVAQTATAEEELKLIDSIESVASMSMIFFPTKRPMSKPIALISPMQLTDMPVTYEPTRRPTKQSIASAAMHHSVAQAASEEELAFIDLIDQSVASIPLADFQMNKPTSNPIAQLATSSVTWEQSKSPSKQPIDNPDIHQPVTQATAEEELMLIDLIDHSMASMPLTDIPTKRLTPKPIASKSSNQPTATPLAHEEKENSQRTTPQENIYADSIVASQEKEEEMNLDETTILHLEPSAKQTAPLPTSLPTPIILDGTRGFSDQENEPSTLETLPPMPVPYNGMLYSNETSYLVNYDQYSEKVPPRRGIIVAITAGILVALAAIAAILSPRVKRCRKETNNNHVVDSENNDGDFGWADNNPSYDEDNIEISLGDASMPRSPNMVVISDIGAFPGGGLQHRESQHRRQAEHSSTPIMSNVSQWLKKSFTSESDMTPVVSNVTANPGWATPSNLMDETIEECDEEDISEMRGTPA